MTPTKAQLKFQLERARRNGLFDALKRSAQANTLPLPFVLAIASRETNIANIEGDHGHGKGVMQVDERYHEKAQNDRWKADPGELIDEGCKLLAGHIKWAKTRWPVFTTNQHLKLAAAAYNAGRGGVLRGMNTGDCDAITTGGNYGKDVLARMVLFAAMLAE